VEAQLRDNQFGITAGPSFSKFGGADAGDPETRTGLAFGGFASFRFSRGVAFRPEVLYVIKGSNDSTAGVHVEFKLSYLEVPLLLTFRLGDRYARVRPTVFFGPAVSTKISCNIAARTPTVHVEQSCADLGLKIAGTDVGAILGGGVEIDRLSATIRYEYGLAGLERSSPSLFDVKNRTFFLLVGYSWRLGRPR
jgi:hypothetical protein